ncbi:primosomal protein [Leptolyngbya sp. FACHB-671]|uniref:primosomal protein n=1 Tax=Leptolyngbya sp. FACHB-671 TaxID=2692812 RepID=UPI00168980BF|nr:primosomal protein [Leptolyngbya sp. FACHB-671]MBD1870092.1 primosomal protein [Cyanobacteria bacterium FACHB-471]MBD2071147.1 primosomal protein [Leptolyngbya sp. FACHB-671]
MAGAVERIEQDIAALDERVRAIAQEFHDTYHQYLTKLGQSVRQQLILASYHICTKGYPERFLKLSFSQRQNLQQSLQKLVQQAQVQLVELIEAAYLEVASADEEEDEIDEDEVESDEVKSDPMASDETDFDETEATDTPDSPQASVAELQTPEFQTLEFQISESQPLEPQPSGFEPLELPLNQVSAEQSEFQAYVPPEVTSASEEESPIAEEQKPTATIDVLDSPEAIAYWEERIEEGIVEMLQTLSHAANRLLQKASILPDKLPEPVLEVAAKSGLATEAVSGPPNLLNLLVETDDDDEEESAVTHIIAIQLRLSEIEFSDATLSTWRSKIRSLLARLVQLGRQYQKKQRERAIAEAEDAWRSSWFEE